MKLGQSQILYNNINKTNTNFDLFYHSVYDDECYPVNELSKIFFFYSVSYTILISHFKQQQILKGMKTNQTVNDLSNNDDQQLSETGKANNKYMSTNSKVRTPNE